MNEPAIYWFQIMLEANIICSVGLLYRIIEHIPKIRAVHFAFSKLTNIGIILRDRITTLRAKLRIINLQACTTHSRPGIVTERERIAP